MWPAAALSDRSPGGDLETVLQADFWQFVRALTLRLLVGPSPSGVHFAQFANRALSRRLLSRPLKDILTMQRFDTLRRPLWAVVLAFCAVGFSALPSSFLAAVAQERQQPGAAAQPGAATQPGRQVDSTDPVLVVTIASLNKLMQDANYLTAAVGQPQAGGMFTMMAGMFTQGLDNTRPIGILVPMVDGSPEPIGLIPSNNVEMMLKRLEAQTGPADRLEDGTLVVAAGPALVYVRQVGNWAVVARNRELIDLVPADPMPLMQGLGDEYDIAFRLNVQEIPVELRDMLVEQLSQGFDQAMARQGREPDQDVAEFSKMQLEQLSRLIREADQLQFGLNINPNRRIVSIDTRFTAAAGTSLARMYAGSQPIPSMFSAVLGGDAAFRYHAAASLSPEAVETTGANITGVKAMLRKALAEREEMDEATRGEVEEMLNGLIDIGVRTMQEGKIDTGIIGMADDSMLRIAGGSFVHDGDEVAQWVKQLAAKLRNSPDAPEFNFDQGQHGGVTMHSVVIDIPAKEEELRRMFGPQATVHLGTGPQAFYFAVGQGSVDVMKGLIDSAGNDRGDVAQRPLVQMRLQLLPILRLAQSVKPNDSLANVIEAVALGGDNDYLSMTGHAIANGQTSYVEIGEGLLKAIGAGIREAQNAQLQQQQRGGGQF
jgi:hypothetical protein